MDGGGEKNCQTAENMAAASNSQSHPELNPSPAVCQTSCQEQNIQKNSLQSISKHEKQNPCSIPAANCVIQAQETHHLDFPVLFSSPVSGITLCENICDI